MGFKKGCSGNQSGRPKGARNKVTRTTRENIEQVFLMLGGVKAFRDWAEKEPTDFYKIYSRLLPRDIEISGRCGGPVEISHVIAEKLSDIYSCN
jgi:hypothetical protein